MIVLVAWAESAALDKRGPTRLISAGSRSYRMDRDGAKNPVR
jgi:hypothetical protein